MAKIVRISLRKICAASVSSRGFRTKLDDFEVALAGGVLLSAKRREGRGSTGLGARFLGRGPVLASGRIVSRGLFLFSLFFLLFLF
jgi:hypothetical protein